MMTIQSQKSSPKNKGIRLLVLFSIILVIVSLACSLPFKIVWTGETDEVQESSEQEQPSSDEDLDTGGDEIDAGEEPAEDEVVPSDTPSPSPSPTFTFTPEPVTITGFISKATNCRLGPQDIYELIHIFKQGTFVDMLGKNEAGSFYYVVDQGSGTIKCWIWKEYTTPEGNVAKLPVFTPPPSPVPIFKFTLSYNSTTGKTKVHVYVQNTGNVPLQSWSATFKDTNTGETLTGSGDVFGNAAKVSVGNTGVISSKEFSANTIGHQMKVNAKICTEDGLLGKCTSQVLNFTSQ
jgi:hypothetical protein